MPQPLIHVGQVNEKNPQLFIHIEEVPIFRQGPGEIQGIQWVFQTNVQRPGKQAARELSGALAELQKYVNSHRFLGEGPH